MPVGEPWRPSFIRLCSWGTYHKPSRVGQREIRVHLGCRQGAGMAGQNEVGWCCALATGGARNSMGHMGLGALCSALPVRPIVLHHGGLGWR